MASAESSPTPSAFTPSRRLVTKGLAWSVPAVAVAAAAPAFSASSPCQTYNWTSTGSASTGTTGQLTGTTNTTQKITATTAVTSGYNLPSGTAYTPLNMTSSSGSVTMSSYKTVATTFSNDKTMYSSTTFKAPTATNGTTFTISGLDSYTTTANATGAQYFTDSVQVLVNGSPIQPAQLSGATYSGGWVTATGTTAGSAVYNIPSGATVEIRLSNAYAGSVPSTAHPNQAITISPVTCGQAAVTYAPSSCTPTPYSRTWVQWLFDDRYGKEHLDLAMSLQINNLPAGVTVQSITWDVWFRGATAASNPGFDIPIWNSSTAYSAGPGVSDRRTQSASSLPWTPGVAGFNSTATSSTTALTSHKFLTGVTANAWNLQFTWTGNNGSNGTYTTGSNGCVNFDTTKANPFRINYSSARTVASMGSGWCGWTSYLEDMFYTVTLSNGCVLKGTFSADVYPLSPTNCDPAAYTEAIKHTVTQTC